MRAETRTYLATALKTIDALRDYWPLTLRQIYYQLVAALVIENNLNEYKRLSRLLSDARLAGELSWDAMEDRSRVLLHSGGWDDYQEFARSEAENFLRGYGRDLLQGQAVRPELWIEKDALSRIAHDVAIDYCIPVIAARGFSSVTFKNDCRKRVLSNVQDGQETVILYFGDLDPSGWEMLPAMLRTLHEDMDLSADLVTGCRYALNPEHVEQYRLPRPIDAIKEKDSRTPKYRKLFGDLAVELDALRPDLLQALVKDAIESNLDLSQFEAERRIEQEELRHLAGMKARIERLLQVQEGAQ
jgi:hypothetical protein